MKIELTINANYLPSWSVWEGVRELCQNGRDAAIENPNVTFEVSHHGNVLRIENDGVTLTHEALLLGTTTKADREDTAGKWGEGMKLGILALARAGRVVKIRSGSEVWTPTIVRSEKFKADVLQFEIAQGREPKNRVRVEIGGVSSVEWAEFRERFLFLRKLKDSEYVKTGAGTLLLGDSMKGKLYVKGIYVASRADLDYGYDFVDAQLDRDRKMIEGYDLEYKTRRTVCEALSRRPDLLDPFYAMLANGTQDTRSFSSFAAADMSKETLAAIGEKFRKQYGADAVPVRNLEQGVELEHFGKRGIVVSVQLEAALAPTIGTADTVKKAMADEVVKTYSRGDLTTPQWTNLEDAIYLVDDKTAATGTLLARVEIVDFRSATLLGQYKASRILIAKRILDDADETLATLVHEVSHSAGGDGEKSHVAAIEAAWKRVCRKLRNRA